MGNNVRELWGDSVLFRGTIAVTVIGSLLLFGSLLSAGSTQRQATDAAADAVQVLEKALNDGSLDLTPQQEQLVQQGIDSMTPQQKQRHDLLLKKWNQRQNPSTAGN